eukprot:2640305-Rhodomonas_salina.1
MVAPSFSHIPPFTTVQASPSPPVLPPLLAPPSPHPPLSLPLLPPRWLSRCPERRGAQTRSSPRSRCLVATHTQPEYRTKRSRSVSTGLSIGRA